MPDAATASEQRPRLTHGEGDDGTLSRDDMFHLLQNRRRRAALKYLRDHDDTVVMRDLAEQVAAWEYDTTTRQLTSDQRQRVYIALYQSHLPKLDDNGVIDYNQSRGIIEPRKPIEELYPYLERENIAEPAASDGGESVDASHAGPEWWKYTAVLGGLSLIALGGEGLGLLAGSPVSGTAIAFLGVAALTVGATILSIGANPAALWTAGGTAGDGDAGTETLASEES